MERKIRRNCCTKYESDKDNIMMDALSDSEDNDDMQIQFTSDPFLNVASQQNVRSKIVPHRMVDPTPAGNEGENHQMVF